jgi:flagellar biosynthesis protein FlhG
MNDQAHELRNLVRHSVAGDVARLLRRSRWVLLTSGKGGTGTTTVALNLAVALAGRHHRTVLVDADPQGGSIGLLCRLRAHYTLADVLSGGRCLPEILQPGPGGIEVIPGAGSLEQRGTQGAVAPQWLISQLESLDARADVIVIDGGNGLSRFVLQGWPHCDVGVVITTPDAAAIMNSYALMKILMGPRGGVLPRCLVNFAPSAAVAEDVQARIAGACARFLALRPTAFGHLSADPAIAAAGQAAESFVLAAPRSEAARQTDRLAEAVMAAASGRQSAAAPHTAMEAIHVRMSACSNADGTAARSNLPVGQADLRSVAGALPKLELTPFSAEELFQEQSRK